MSARAAIGRRPRTRRLGRVLRLMAAGAVLGIAGGFAVFAAALDRVEAVPPGHADGIVALTGGADRVPGALGLLLAGHGDRLLISGVNPSASALDLIRTAPEARRLLGCCIELGYAAETTVGNARETLAWVRRHRLRSLIVVTSNYHMPRALAEIGDAVPGVALVPFPVVGDRPEGWWREGGGLRLMLAEYAKFLVVLARIHLSPSVPYDAAAASLGGLHLPQGG